MSEIWDGGCIDCLRREMLNRSPFSLIACVSTTPLIQSEFDKCCWLEEDSPGILHGNFENGLIFLRHCLHGNSVCDELESHYPADTWASAVPFETPPGEMRVSETPPPSDSSTQSRPKVRSWWSGELQPAIISRGNKTGAAMYAAYKLPLLKSKVYINYFPSLIINNNWCCLCTSCRWWQVTINGKQNKLKDRFYVSPHPRFSGAELSPVKVWNQHISLTFLPTHYLITTKMWLLLSHSRSRQWQKKVAVQCKSSSEKKSQQAISC